MQVQTKRRFIIAIDEDEAEEFLDNAEALQAKVREHLRATNGGHSIIAALEPYRKSQIAATLPAPRGRKAKAPKATGKGRRPMKKTPCPECEKELPGHWLVRHRQKVHGVVPTVEVESAE